MLQTAPAAVTDSPALKLELAPLAHRVPARAGTRSCAGRDPCSAVALRVEALNTSTRALRFSLREEWHGGALPATSLFGCVRPVQRAGSCQPVYLVESQPTADRPSHVPVKVTLSPGERTQFDVRLDWAGTASIMGVGFVDPTHAGGYEAALGLRYEVEANPHVAVSPVTHVMVPAP